MEIFLRTSLVKILILSGTLQQVLQIAWSFKNIYVWLLTTLWDVSF